VRAPTGDRHLTCVIDDLLFGCGRLTSLVLSSEAQVSIMTEYEFPLRSGQSLVQRLDHAPPGADVRRWVLRDDNDQHYHGVVPLTTDPIVLELRWKPNARGREQVVGLYRLHLAALLAAGYIRREGDDVNGTQVRLRFHRGERGVVSIQINQSEPALPIGMVDRSFA
jgi:hypothetical protein